MYGVGYPVLQQAVGGHYVVLVLLGLLAAKILATSLTMWIGGSGGVFAPSLFMGAMLGTAYGTVAHHLMPHLAAAAGAYGLVGMGAVFAATARAPITGLIIIFELTGNYRIILPLMCAVVVATALSNKLTKDTIYTLKLRRRGIDIDTPKTPSRMAQITVAKAMGIIAAVDVERAIDHGPDDTANGAGLAREVPRLLASDSLEDAVRALGGTDDEGLPVIDDNNQVLGWITHRRVLRAYLARCGSADPPETESPDSLA